MAGVKNVHDDIVVNLVGELRAQVRGSGCRPFTGDGSVEAGPGRIRRPDVGVDCGPRDPNGTKAALPRLVVEVCRRARATSTRSKSSTNTRNTDTLEYVVLVEPNEPVVFFWRRNARAWVEAQVRGLDAQIDMPEIGVRLQMAAIYEGVQFPVRPRLVSTDE